MPANEGQNEVNEAKTRLIFLFERASKNEVLVWYIHRPPSAAPLKLTTKNYDNMISFDKLHYLNQRATPNQLTTYKHALLLHKTYNDENMVLNWQNLFFNQYFNDRDPLVKFFNNSKYKVGNNILSNRFTTLNGKTLLSWLNLSFVTYKIKCKHKFMEYVDV